MWQNQITRISNNEGKEGNTQGQNRVTQKVNGGKND